jgi:hypothetical protein
VLRTILLDDEARSAPWLADHGVRQAARTHPALPAMGTHLRPDIADDSWNIGDLSDQATRLGQSPLRSPSVFNFFRPGYVPPNSRSASAGITAPEFQITTEPRWPGLQLCADHVRATSAAMTATTPPAALAGNSQRPCSELNIVLAADADSADTVWPR